MPPKPIKLARDDTIAKVIIVVGTIVILLLLFRQKSSIPVDSGIVYINNQPGSYSLNWGTLSVGQVATKEITVQNGLNYSITTFYMSTSNFEPTAASQYLTITMSYPDSEQAKLPLAPGQTMRITITLKVGTNAVANSNFKFDIILSATDA